jgi:hypothetical protein
MLRTHQGGGEGAEFVNATTGCDKAIYAYLGGTYDPDAPPAITAGMCMYAYLLVLGSKVEKETAAEYGRILKAGFLLEWSGAGGIGDYEACGRGGGECRYSNASGDSRASAPAGSCTTRHAPVSTYVPVQP